MTKPDASSAPDPASAASWSGQVVGLFIAPEAGAPMQAVDAVRAVPGRGLDGDRYFKGEGAFSRWDGPRREVTLIAREALAAAEAETGIPLAPEETRRNVLVEGVPLGDLVRTEFRVGDVWLKGNRRCQPCKRLLRLADKPDALLDALVNRGGLRAQIRTEAELQVGDRVRPLPGAG
jgi:MOSC domain-containing protein YiiM